MKQIYVIITILMLVGCKSRTSEPANAAAAFAVALSLAPVEQQLKEAQANKKIAFLVLTSGNLRADNKAFRIVQEAQKEARPSVIIAIDCRDTFNK